MSDELRTMKQATRASGKELGARRYDASCRRCNTFDPFHVKRSRRRSRGVKRPASIADVMHCPNCGHEWVERTLTRLAPQEPRP